MFEKYRWNENLSEKESIRQFPGLNSSLKKEKKGMSLLYLLSISMRADFI